MIHIAYIDADETSRFTFEQSAVLLRARGINNDVRFYTELDLALAELPFDRPHITFIDMRARSLAHPNDGLGLIRHLRHYPLCRHMVIIGMALYAMPADETAARAAGCNDFLPKPIRYQTVENLMVDHLLQYVP